MLSNINALLVGQPSIQLRFRLWRWRSLSACIVVTAMMLDCDCVAEDNTTDRFGEETGQSLRVVVRVVEPFVYAATQGASPSGYSVDVWDRITRILEAVSKLPKGDH